MDSTLKTLFHYMLEKVRDVNCAVLTILREKETCTIFQELLLIQTDLYNHVFTPNLS